jgi:NADH-quinone oxidoreductase subunit E
MAASKKKSGNPADETSLDLKPAQEIISRIRHSSGPQDTAGHLIPILQRIQDAYGYLPKTILEWISRETAIPMARMYGVITFYSQFYTQPRNRHTIKCCVGTACHVKGAKRIAEAISDELGVERGGTTKNRQFTFETVACLGTCFLAPVVMIDKDYYGQLTPARIPRIIEKYD